ncbi:MAB_1171c family putative transporter (plasmid) [Streptomyces sp. BI20]|uniref:MAB_1171c family putative transporter n=1 Tax=Streptomyces sp. BI20 TaxID=3403460 RepID=UPI003C741F00
MDGRYYYLPALAYGTVFLLRLPGRIRHRHDPQVRAVNRVIALAVLAFLLAAPPSISAINRFTGVPNLAAPLVYSTLCAFGGACLVLVEYWRHGDGPRTRRRVRAWCGVYVLVVIVLNLFFAVGDAPEERLRDLDTHYADTPGIREMIVTYLLAYTGAAVVTTGMCLRWARRPDVRGWMRAGLRVLVAGFTLGALFGLAKSAAVVARWFGHDLDALSTWVAPPIVSLGSLALTCGLLLPMLGPKVERQWRAWRELRALRPLWEAIRPHGIEPGARVPLRSDLPLRLTYRQVAVDDAFLRLGERLDDRVRRAAEDRAFALGQPEERARRIGLAVMLAVAGRQGPGDRPVPGEEAAAGRAALTAGTRNPGDRARLAAALASPAYQRALPAPAPDAGPRSHARR